MLYGKKVWWTVGVVVVVVVVVQVTIIDNINCDCSLFKHSREALKRSAFCAIFQTETEKRNNLPVGP